ncbi:mechanosensitive ion channel family protein [Phytoactinopolyspora mesophila]|uniref:Mechanosensitive ion channel n=1 Tax=Phytoactinopolyspora mesophila TaxID=2650750 RepID=A0A7K3M7S2_9ACTN|nr:mechanosensitive ion channel family protein [Phytoactinopolyspora mesophila]NDL58992.1 mechanosensitive ion channel [Phytoactinopolyspora mesophila]
MTVFIQTQNDDLERFTSDWWADVLLDRPIHIAALVLIALVIRYLLHKLIRRLVDRSVEKEPRTRVLGSKTAARVVLGGAGVYSDRRVQRVQTLGSLGKSVSTALVATVAIVMTLEILGYPIGPLLASAGIAGVALGFGAQNLVKDFLAGIAMLIEDQYGVGDVIDMGEAAGVVESVSLRVTRLRAVDGTVWYVRNGEVMRIGNSSQDWARAVIDVGVAYDSDTAVVRRLLEEVSNEMAAEEVWSDLILEEPEVWGVEALNTDSVDIRLVVQTRPLEQWKVARELRERIKRRFDAEGIEIPFPQRTLWLRQDGGPQDETPLTPAPPASGPAAATTEQPPAAAGSDGEEELTPTADTPDEQQQKAERPPAPEV